MPKTIVGVMGPGEGATPEDLINAEELGKRIAAAGWLLLTGGRDEGVMDAAAKGAKAAGGETIGILPTKGPGSTSTHIDIAIYTDLGQGRNSVNVLTSNAVVAVGMGPGTASEVSLALKSGKPVVMMTADKEAVAFFSKLGGPLVTVAADVAAAAAALKKTLE
uniref:Cytochrome n=1 Tax=Chromera velia CCMP2878 TaxID=1169474 RepID=A0A0G4FER2_9ALVE|eukprot:Cvel_16637.t1-p1 / transcript=Cvel_16637.t1 / gene=Cvel_16637 / organism=Chromera_velia_CCMP2878 / gene_product=Uncharacterized protein AF_1126, putative / transcript_product=Uncharacterized protein AF_1126, putative / location=Cvel_scaffold1290:7617-8102(+) / protein_length=162 / sequence_SO=supercontig / SO=protein_coding / is_pseudo=false